MNKIKNKENYINTISNEEDKILLEKICSSENEFNRIYNRSKNNEKKCEYFVIYKLTFSHKIENKINAILKDNLTDNNMNKMDNYSQNKRTFILFKKSLIEVLTYVNIIDKDSFIAFTQNKKELIVHNYHKKKNIYKINRKKAYNNIISENENEIKEDNVKDIINKDIDFKDVLFQKIMEYLKYEIGYNIESVKSQRVIFCTSFIQSHIEDVPKEYSENNYSKLFMELIKETLTILNYLNSNILNQLYNKIKEGNKLNMIITSYYLQIKSMEKYKCIEYLYSKILIPNKFKITKDDKNNVTKVEYIREVAVKTAVPPTPQPPEEINQNSINNNINDKRESKELKDSKKSKKEFKLFKRSDKRDSKVKKNEKYSSRKNLNDIVNEKNNNNNQQKMNKSNIEIGTSNDSYINNNNNELNKLSSSLPPPKLELIQNLIDIIPNYREYEQFSDNILKIEEDTDISTALKNFFKTMKILVKKENIVKRFSKDEINLIVIELENYILFKLYDKLYPTKSSKDDIKFYKKCCRLQFIKPHNLITDKNIINEKLWNTSIDYINEINNKYSPADKIKSLSKSFSILQNSITFCSGKKELGVDDTIKPLIYILLKSKPTNIFNNYNYCQLFLNSDLAKKEYGILLTQIYMIMRIIKDMKYNELIGVSEQQFGKDEE